MKKAEFKSRFNILKQKRRIFFAQKRLVLFNDVQFSSYHTWLARKENLLGGFNILIFFYKLMYTTIKICDKFSGDFSSHKYFRNINIYFLRFSNDPSQYCIDLGVLTPKGSLLTHTLTLISYVDQFFFVRLVWLVFPGVLWSTD